MNHLSLTQIEILFCIKSGMSNEDLQSVQLVNTQLTWFYWTFTTHMQCTSENEDVQY